MKKFAILIVIVVFLAGCVGKSSQENQGTIAKYDKNTPPPLPDAVAVRSSSDNALSTPNSKSAEPANPSPDSPPPVPALLGLPG